MEQYKKFFILLTAFFILNGAGVFAEEDNQHTDFTVIDVGNTTRGHDEESEATVYTIRLDGDPEATKKLYYLPNRRRIHNNEISKKQAEMLDKDFNDDLEEDKIQLSIYEDGKYRSIKARRK